MEQKTMKAVVFREKGKVELTDVPVPQIIEPDDAIVKVTLSTICGSDIHILHGFVPAVKNGTIVGHEFVGEIVEAGPAVDLPIGTRVAAACSDTCGKCFYCKRGVTAFCEAHEELTYFGCTADLDGCQAEYVRVPHANYILHQIPEGVSDDSALFVGDILSTGYFGALNAGLKHGDTVAVYGCGPVGICAAAVCRLFGVARIIMVDTEQSRLEFAKKNGYADVILNPKNEDVAAAILKLTEGRGVDSAIEAAGAAPTLDMAFNLTRKSGYVSVISIPFFEYNIPINTIVYKNLTVHAGCVNTDRMDDLLTLIQHGALDLTPLITHKKPLNDVLEGYDVFGNKKDNCIKWAITPYVK